MKTPLTIALILIASTCIAAPFLTCDPYPTVAPMPTYFSVSVDGSAPVDSLPVSTTGGLILKYDIASLAKNVQHTITVKACDLWGCSEEASIGPFTPSVPAKPGALSITNR